MPVHPPQAAVALSDYERSRQLIPDHEWDAYDKMWVGIALDGRSIVAGAPDLSQLEAALQGKGLRLDDVSLEYVELEDDLMGGQAEAV